MILNHNRKGSFLSSLFALDVASWPPHNGYDGRGITRLVGYSRESVRNYHIAFRNEVLISQTPVGVSAAIIIPLLAILVLPAIRPRSHGGGAGSLETERRSEKEEVRIWTPPRWPRRKGAGVRDLEQARMSELAVAMMEERRYSRQRDVRTVSTNREGL
jgi:hypothetical protein